MRRLKVAIAASIIVVMGESALADSEAPPPKCLLIVCPKPKGPTGTLVPMADVIGIPDLLTIGEK